MGVHFTCRSSEQNYLHKTIENEENIVPYYFNHDDDNERTNFAQTH